MTREDIRQDILNIKSNNLLLLLATSVGKTKCALDVVNSKSNIDSILIVIPRLVLIDNWKDEFKKWGYAHLLKITQFTTYISLPKEVQNSYSIVIYDECHHLSERCLDAIPDIKSQYNVLLSATVKQQQLNDFKRLFNNLYVYKISLKEAIQDTILPDPTVYLIPLTLDNTKYAHTIVKNNKTAKHTLHIPYEDMWKYIKNPQYQNFRIVISCTQQQYYKENESLIQWYKTKIYNSVFRNKFQQACLKRLKWLSEQKQPIILDILQQVKDKRTLTFCSSIEQTEVLGEHCINSKNKQSTEVLNKFQNKEINHITACGMLNEGANLVDCQVGIFASLHSSEIIITQRNGRLLRHTNPIFIIPYYINTRDEEIVNEMLKDYNNDKVIKIKNVETLQQWLNE